MAALIYKLFVANFGCCYKVDECGKRIQDECGNCIMECEKPKLDKCGRPLVDDCGKTITEKVEVLETKHGYKQETYKKEAMNWFNKHGVNIHALDKKCDKIDVTIVNQAPVTPVIDNLVNPVNPVNSVLMPVMKAEVPVIEPITTLPSINQLPVMPKSALQGRNISNSPYLVPKY